MGFEKGDVVSGTVTKIVDYGAFVELDSGGTGLIHISKLSTRYVRDVHEFVKEGDRVTATVVSVDGNRVGLSLIGDSENRSRTEPKKSFESMLSVFLQSSNKHQQCLQKQQKSTRRRRDKIK